jgi:replication factor A1
MAVPMSDYKALFSTLMGKSSLSSQELEKRLDEKIESLGHLVNEDVALRLVAKDLNISLLNEETKKPSIQVVDLVPNMNNVNLELIVDSVGALREFVKKDGKPGKLIRASVSDASGKASLIAWDEQTKVAEPLSCGSKIFVHSAYTKSGLRGDMEIHLGNRSRLEVISASKPGSLPSNNGPYKGRVWRTSDQVIFNRKDGSQGSMVSFQLKDETRMIRVLVWNPPIEKLSSLKEGVFVEILNGALKADLNGKQELHVNDVDSIHVWYNDVVEIKRDLIRLANVEPNMTDIDVEAIIEMVFEISKTYNGKSYLKMLIRDEETILPVILWNEKALELNGKVQKGLPIRLENCFAKLGPQGLELGINRWSKVLIKKKLKNQINNNNNSIF